jgi:hypothetical protein
MPDADGAPLGLVHQDVSPHNVLVGYDGAVKLLDFGVARLGARDASRTDTVRGKPSYLAPEQLRGERVDRRTDVFAAGIVLHEMLTGERLFRAGSVAESYKSVVEDEIPDVRARRPEIPAELAEVVARALRREAGDRFTSAAEMRRVLLGAAAAGGIRPVEPPEIGAWCASVVAPAVTARELEREILEHTPASDTSTTELPTVRVERATEPARRRRAARWAILTAGALGLGVGVVVMAGGPRSLRVEAAPALLASASWGAAARAPEPALAAPPVETGDARATPSPEASSASGLRARPAAGDRPPPYGVAPSAGATSAASAAPAAEVREAPAAPPPAVPSGASELGYLSIKSTPWGEVRIDGVVVGQSPIARLALRPGAHEVTVVTPQGRQTRRVVVQAGAVVVERFAF